MSNKHQPVTHLPRPGGALSLFGSITDFGNLYAAYKAAARGKHDRASVLRHDLHAEKILWRLQWELKNGWYRHGTYRHFVVAEPKARDVHAAPFTDRIVHHAVTRVIEPLFEPGFIFDSYACRKGKGSHKAALRLQHFLRSALNQNPRLYVLRADIRKYFASIDHATLQTILARKIHDSEVLSLLRAIINSYHTPENQNGLGGGQAHTVHAAKTGLPIGNLTSQLFANAYLNELDQFVKHNLREPYYIRYMDDFLVLHHDKAHLQRALKAIQQFCEHELKLTLHPKKTGVHMFVERERFVGYDLGPYLRRLSKPTLQRFVRRIKKLQARDDVAAAISIKQFKAYASFAHTAGLLASWEHNGHV